MSVIGLETSTDPSLIPIDVLHRAPQQHYEAFVHLEAFVALCPGAFIGAAPPVFCHARNSPFTGSPPSLSCFSGKSPFTIVTGYFEPSSLKHHLRGARNFSASAVGAADRVYLLSEKGRTVVLKRGPRPEVLAVNSLDETFFSSPAIVGNQIFLRGDKLLFCFSQSSGQLVAFLCPPTSWTDV